MRTVIALIFLLLTGCVSQQEQAARRALFDYHAGRYEQAIQTLRPLAEKTDEHFVLNNLRLGSSALVDYRLDEAEAAFLRAYEVINSVGVNNGGRTLGAILVDEKLRIWKGEPFERAMANFYLGLIYYIRHDYANARGAFENALFKLEDDPDRQKNGAGKTVGSDFALAYVMLGRCWQRLGRDDLAEANFRRAIELRPALRDLADPNRNRQSNLLLVIDYGYGPQKATEFDGSVVGFTPPPQVAGPIPRPLVMIDGRASSLSGLAEPPVDLLAMAQDRKWQSIDTIRAVKSALGTGLIVGGAGYGVYSSGRRGGMSGNDALVTGALIGTGLLLKATSQADTRQWEMLPRTTFILPLCVPPGEHEIVVDFPQVYGLRQTWTGIKVPAQGEATYYFRTQRFNHGPHRAPPVE